MSVPSNSPKYICANCRQKISTADIEEIFQEQLQSIPLSYDIAENASLCDYWPELTKDEKRLLVEQAVDRIIIGKNEIQIEFYQLNSSQMLADGQQMAREQHEENEPTRVINAKEEEQTPLTLNEPLLNETDAAKFLGISRMTLLRKRNNNEIKFFRVGFRVLYSKEKHLLPFLTQCEKGTIKKNNRDS